MSLWLNLFCDHSSIVALRRRSNAADAHVILSAFLRRLTRQSRSATTMTPFAYAAFCHHFGLGDRGCRSVACGASGSCRATLPE